MKKVILMVMVITLAVLEISYAEVRESDLVGMWSISEKDYWEFYENSDYMAKLGFGYTEYYEFKMFSDEDSTYLFIRPEQESSTTYTSIYLIDSFDGTNLILKPVFKFGFILYAPASINLPDRNDDIFERLTIKEPEEEEVILTRQ